MTPHEGSLRCSAGGAGAPPIALLPTTDEQRVLLKSRAARDGQPGVKCQLCDVSVLKCPHLQARAVIMIPALWAVEVSNYCRGHA